MKIGETIEIIRPAIEAAGISLEECHKKSHDHSFSWQKQYLFYYLRQKGHTLKEVQKYFDYVSHTTISKSGINHESEYSVYKDYKREYDLFEAHSDLLLCKRLADRIKLLRVIYETWDYISEQIELQKTFIEAKIGEAETN